MRFRVCKREWCVYAYACVKQTQRERERLCVFACMRLGECIWTCVFARGRVFGLVCMCVSACMSPICVRARRMHKETKNAHLSLMMSVYSAMAALRSSVSRLTSARSRSRAPPSQLRTTCATCCFRELRSRLWCNKNQKKIGLTSKII